MYDSLESFLKKCCTDGKFVNQKVFQEITDFMGLQKFTQTDVDLALEYANLLEPLAKVLDIFQVSSQSD